ncbi:unnamed protein product [Oppiella nova]|uniref:Glycosyl hydrolase family 30 TIM-barrel domain-containing protein n=1 Tax=Oppiella nova TaxID=334625 RepID=A0A7R9MJN0_9ACAR|nr:unnamed protein product [Oppiella nova]CAG2177451.1 unnamed protein product [Oppiella nova]
MKTNHKFNNGGELRGTVGGEYYQSGPTISFLDAYKSHDINLWGVTVENESTRGTPSKGCNCLNLTGLWNRIL